MEQSLQPENRNRSSSWDNYAQLWDKNGTYQTICRRCGGRRWYHLQSLDARTHQVVKSEIVKCDECEEGFRYGRIEET